MWDLQRIFKMSFLASTFKYTQSLLNYEAVWISIRNFWNHSFHILRCIGADVLMKAYEVNWIKMTCQFLRIGTNVQCVVPCYYRQPIGRIIGYIFPDKFAPPQQQTIPMDTTGNWKSMGILPVVRWCHALHTLCSHVISIPYTSVNEGNDSSITMLSLLPQYWCTIYHACVYSHPVLIDWWSPSQYW